MFKLRRGRSESSEASSSEEVFKSRRSRVEAKQTKEPRQKEDVVWRRGSSINNLEFEKRREVEQQISEKEKKIKGRQRRGLVLRLGGGVLVALFVVWSVGALSRRSNVEIDMGQDTAYGAKLKSEAELSLNRGLVGQIVPASTRYDQIEKGLLDQYAELAKVEMSFNLIKMRTDIKVEVNKPLVKWTGSGGQVVYVGQNGKVFNPEEEFLKLFNPVEITGGSVVNGEDGRAADFVGLDRLRWLVGAIPTLREGQVEPLGVNIEQGSLKGLEVLIEQGVRVRFSIEEDPARSAEATVKAIKFLRENRQGGVGGLSYIDARTPDRIVYK